jgi:hypothetical protein
MYKIKKTKSGYCIHHFDLASDSYGIKFVTTKFKTEQAAVDYLIKHTTMTPYFVNKFARVKTDVN